MKRLTRVFAETTHGTKGYEPINKIKVDTESICNFSEIITTLGLLEDVLEKRHIEDLDKFIEEQISKERKLNDILWKMVQELSELKQKAIVLPFEFDEPIYKLCPKCNDRQTDCKNCAWSRCGFNQCYDICHKENKGQIIREIIFKKDNCNVSWNALSFISEHWGKYYFATKEEAEQELARIKGEKDERRIETKNN